MKSLPCLLVLVAACSGSNGGRADGGGGGTTDAARTDGGSVTDGGPGADAGSGTTGGSATISILVEPNGNSGSELVAAITAAQTSVDMTMYELDNTDVINALVARAAHIPVAVVLDSSSTNKSFNTPAYTKLNAAAHGSAVWSSTAFTYTHEKTVIIDGKTAWIMTMNATKSAPVDNREYLAIDTTPAHVTEATAIFTADHALQSITPTGDLVVADTNARAKLVALIATATKTLDVEGEEFSDSGTDGVVDAVAAAASRGVTVHVIVGNATPDKPSIATVKSAGGKVVVTGPTSANGTPSDPYIHAKAIVVDCVSGTCARAFVGSENFSGGSLGYNRELGVELTDAAQIAKVKAAIDTDFAAGVAQ